MTVSTVRAAISLLVLAASTPLAAQSLEELDALSDRTADEASGIQTALEQTARGELLEALATLERVLALYPESDEARFNHATLLCWVDDPQGAEVEFARLDEDDYAPGALQQARENCRAATDRGQQ
jgi:hypothetical protein